MGLAISRRLAQLLGGDVTIVASTPDAGSTFRLSVATGSLDGVEFDRFERACSLGVAARSESHSGNGSMNSTLLKGVRILLAEDGTDNQRLISYTLSKAGAAVTVVDNGKLAVEQALLAQQNGNAFQLVLMDMQMPVMDGYEATALLRSKGYRQPIVALTAHAMTGDRQKCLAAGCDDYAAKPINREQLIVQLAAICSGTTELRAANA